MSKKRISVLSIDEIKVVGRRRRLNTRKVEQIADSIRVIGLQTPITVHVDKSGNTWLDTGIHRIEAMKLLGEKKIDCFIVKVKKLKRQLWQAAENVFRASLNALERAEAIARITRNFNKLAAMESESSAKGGDQPNDKGLNKSARKLGLSREAIRRARDIAALPPEIKRAARKNGLDRNQNALLKIAKEKTTAAQSQKLDDLTRGGTREPYEPSSSELKQLNKLVRRLRKAKNLRREASKATPYVLRMFAREIAKLARSAPSTKSQSAPAS